MNTNFDTLLDSALAKDKSRLPEQPLLPDASLQAKLASTPPSAPINGAAVSSAGIGGLSTTKLGMIALGCIGLGTAAYFYFQDPSVPAPAQITPAPQTNEVLQKPLSSPEETPAAVMLIKKRSLTDSLKLAVKKDSLTQQPKTSVEENLIPPTTPPKKYPADSTKVPIHAK